MSSGQDVRKSEPKRYYKEDAHDNHPSSVSATSSFRLDACALCLKLLRLTTLLLFPLFQFCITSLCLFTRILCCSTLRFCAFDLYKLSNTQANV